FDLNLTIRQEKSGEEITFYLAGEIDTYTAIQLQEALNPAVEQSQEEVTVDLSGSNHIASTGLGVVIRALKVSHANDGKFVLTGLTDRVKRLFTITGLDELMTINDVEKEELK